MVSVLASGVVKSGFKSRSCRFSNEHIALRSKSKDGLARNQDNVYDRSDMSTSGMLFQLVSTIKIQQRDLVWYKSDIITSNVICSRHNIAEQLLIWH